MNRRSPAVLFVGARSGALAAARRLGIPAAVLADEPQGTRAGARLAVVDFADREALVEAARGFAGFTPTHVLALNERSVVPAAWLREALGLPGTESAVARRCHDKVLMKRALAKHGVAVTQWTPVGARASAAALLEQLGAPLVLKPRTSSGSRGLVISAEPVVLQAALRDRYIAERFVDGTEMSVEAIRAHGRTLFVNTTAYHEPLWANLMPAALPPELHAAVVAVNERVLDALGVRRGISHLELFLTPAGPVVGEVAIRPPGGYLMRMLELAWGFDPWEALLRIVVLGEVPDLPPAPAACAAARIFHPGAGTVRRVTGVRAARAWPETVELRIRVRAGTRVEARLGAGQEAGHAILRGTDRAALAARLDELREVVRIEVE